MGRKNARAATSGKIDRRAWRPARPGARGARPAGFCPSRKLRYQTDIEAKVALASAQVNRERKAAEKVERRIYECPLCHGWHLTSKEERA